MTLSVREFDPLVALHDRRLEEHPDWESSVLSDDEMIDLLKSTKDPKELSFLNMELSKQVLPGNQGESECHRCKKIKSPSRLTDFASNESSGSILSFESRSSGTASQLSSGSSVSQ
jgi:hypothetical protein